MDSTKDSQCLEVEDGLSAKCYSSCRYLLSVNHTKTRPQRKDLSPGLMLSKAIPATRVP